MKEKIIGVVTFIFILAMLAVPTFAASSSYSYTMLYRVDGKEEGKFHALNSGNANISGYSFYTGSHENWADISSKGESVTYSLYKEGFFFDSSYGRVSQYVSENSDMYHVAHINQTFPVQIDESSNKYYLVIEKANNGWKMNGTGTLSN